MPAGCAGLVYARSAMGARRGLAQFIITPVLMPAYEEADELSDTCRGTGGFGSTGK